MVDKDEHHRDNKQFQVLARCEKVISDFRRFFNVSLIIGHFSIKRKILVDTSYGVLRLNASRLIVPLAKLNATSVLITKLALYGFEKHKNLRTKFPGAGKLNSIKIFYAMKVFLLFTLFVLFADAFIGDFKYRPKGKIVQHTVALQNGDRFVNLDCIYYYKYTHLI